jgi:dTDP-4-amino-4,6-dideoxygalactose transaminase
MTTPGHSGAADGLLEQGPGPAGAARKNPDRAIRMVDLVSQHAAIRGEIEEAIGRVMDAAQFINGPEVRAFEAELGAYLGGAQVVGCGNGTDALQIAMMALGLRPGDEVITADFTFVATAEVIALLGLVPVLVDVDPDTFTIDPRAVERAIGPRTRAILPVHLFGQCADMDAILALARRHDLHVIEDAAQALGAEHRAPGGTARPAGTIGAVGCTSFFPSKNLGACGDGGALFTADEALARRLRSLTTHGVTPAGPPLAGVASQGRPYVHELIGINSRLDSLQAAILRLKLRRLGAYTAARQRAAAAYDRAFAGHPRLRPPARAPWSSHVFHQYTLRLDGLDREGLRAHLAARGIPSMVYYPVPLHRQPAYLDPRHQDRDFPVTEALCRSVLSLPMHTELDDAMIDAITRAVLEFADS